MSKEQVRRGSRNIFADIGFPDAETHQLKAHIVSEIDCIMRNRKLTQKAAGELMGISQPEVSRMLKGHFEDYSVERLMNFLTVFNRDVEIVVKRRSDNLGRGTVSFNNMAIA